MHKYTTAINAINEAVNDFNKVLLPQHHIETLDLAQIDNQDYFLNLNGKKWENLKFPEGRDYGGIYFYFGYSIRDLKKIGVYVGKASLNRNIGHRLWSHFVGMDAKRDSEQRLLHHDSYAIELITSIPIKKREYVFLAPALEEYLILNLDGGDDLSKFNYVGNY